MIKADSPEGEAALRAIETRRSASEAEALRVADDAIVGVRVGGDTFVRRQIATNSTTSATASASVRSIAVAEQQESRRLRSEQDRSSVSTKSSAREISTSLPPRRVSSASSAST